MAVTASRFLVQDPVADQTIIIRRPAAAVYKEQAVSPSSTCLPGPPR